MNSHAVLLVFATLRIASSYDCGVMEVYNNYEDDTHTTHPVLHYPRFRNFSDADKFIDLTKATKSYGCVELRNKYPNTFVLTVSTTKCLLGTTLMNYKATGAKGIIVSVNDSLDRIYSNKSLLAAEKTTFPLMFTPDSTTVFILNNMNETKTQKVRIRILSPDPNNTLPIDISIMVIFGLAVTTFVVGCYLNGRSLENLLLAESTKASKSQTSQEATTSKPPAEDDDIIDSPIQILKFVLLMCTFLMIMYFFYEFLVYFILAVYVFAGSIGTYIVLEPLLNYVPCGSFELPLAITPFSEKPWQMKQLFLIIAIFAMCFTWLLIRHMYFSWILQDIISFFFCLNVITTLRLPSMKICTMLLVLLFFYDIFFVFVTPLFTKGESVMVHVAKGGKTHEQLPILYRAPNMNIVQRQCQGRDYAMLGLGDVIVPSLAGSYYASFDVVHNTGRVYYVLGCIMYMLGLIITFLGLFLMRMAQPALMYLVPCILIPALLVSFIRGELYPFWHGLGPQPKEQTQQQ